jgi:hypothetical protein
MMPGMITALLTFLGFLGGFLAGMLLSLGGYIIATSVFGMFDRDGGGAMGAIFIIGPFLGLILGTIVASLVFRRRMRRVQPAA